MARFAALSKIQETSEPRQEIEAGQSPVANSPSTQRPKGKRQDPAYQQISAYVRRDLYDMIRRDLIGKPDDFSDLLEQWMEQWKISREGKP